MFGVDVTQVEALKGRRLQLTFSDGVKAVLEMDKILTRGYGGVFAPLLEENYFARVRVDGELGTIVWPNGADVCPDVLYLQAVGTALMAHSNTTVK